MALTLSTANNQAAVLAAFNIPPPAPPQSTQFTSTQLGGSGNFGGGGAYQPVNPQSTQFTSTQLGGTTPLQTQAQTQVQAQSTPFSSTIFGTPQLSSSLNPSITQSVAPQSAYSNLINLGTSQGFQASILRPTDTTYYNPSVTYTPYGVLPNTSSKIDITNPNITTQTPFDKFLSKLTSTDYTHLPQQQQEDLLIGKTNYTTEQVGIGLRQGGTSQGLTITPYTTAELTTLGANPISGISPLNALNKIQSNLIKDTQNVITQKTFDAQFKLDALQKDLQDKINNNNLDLGNAQKILTDKTNQYTQEIQDYINKQNDVINSKLEKAGGDITLKHAVFMAPVNIGLGYGTGLGLSLLPQFSRTVVDVAGLGFGAYQGVKGIQDIRATQGVAGLEKLGALGINTLSFISGTKSSLNAINPRISDAINAADLRVTTASKIDSGKALVQYINKINVEDANPIIQNIKRVLDAGGSVSKVDYKLVSSPNAPIGTAKYLKDNIKSSEISQIVVTDRLGNVVNSYQIGKVNLDIVGVRKPFVRDIIGRSEGTFNDEGILTTNTVSLIGKNANKGYEQGLATRTVTSALEFKAPETMSITLPDKSAILIPKNSASLVFTSSKDSLLGIAEPVKRAKFVNPEQISALEGLRNIPSENLPGISQSLTNLKEVRLRTGGTVSAMTTDIGAGKFSGLSVDSSLFGKGEGNVFFDRNALSPENRITKAGKNFPELPKPKVSIKVDNGLNLRTEPSPTDQSLIESKYPSYVQAGGQPSTYLAYMNDIFPSPSSFAIREALKGVPEPIVYPPAASGFGVNLPANDIIAKNVNVRIITPTSLKTEVSNDLITPSTIGASLILPTQTPNTLNINRDVIKTDSTLRDLTNLSNPQIQPSITQNQQRETQLQRDLLQQREVQQQPLINPSLTLKDITTITPPPPTPDLNFNIKKRIPRQPKDIFQAITKRRGKEIVLGESTNPLSAERLAVDTSLRTLARSVIVREKSTGRQIPILNPSSSLFRVSKRNSLTLVQSNALSSKSETAEIQAARKSKIKPSKSFAKARKFTKVKL